MLPKLRSELFPTSPNISISDPAASVREASFRAEFFTKAQLEVHARGLAGRHKVSFERQSDSLLRRLEENEKFLKRAYVTLTQTVLKDRRLTPAAEWLIDNFYLIEEEIRTARRHLPLRYSRDLPHITNGSAVGQPRIYHIAYELLIHLDGRLDVEVITSFVAAYQQGYPLKLGELWAVPIMLRLALIEYIRQVVGQVVSGLKDRDQAYVWANKLVEAAQSQPATLVMILGDLARANPPLNSAFVAEMSRLLQGRHQGLALPLAWLEQRVAEQSHSLEELLNTETQTQAADQVSMGNCVAGLRVLGAIDWRAFVEALSSVEKTLQKDPLGIYGRMDFATRDRYRHAVEDIAIRSKRTENEVAMAAVALAASHPPNQAKADREAHVGYYLIDEALPLLEKQLQARLPFNRRLGRLILRFPLLFYVGFVALITIGCTWGFIAFGEQEVLPVWAEGVGLVALALCASQLAIAVVNWMTTLLVPACSMPRMDFSHGIPPEFKTIIVIPTMLDSEEGIARLLEGLEVRFVGNQDPQLCFALLTDFRDAAQAVLPEDEHLVELARQGVEKLNQKYAPTHPPSFFLVHRPRRWNEREKRWMGHERKRGKLEEFNALLQRGETAPFAALVGDREILRSVRFVITLDTDTELPREAARQLVATMAHPLIRPVFDPVQRKVVHGYGVLQPRVAVSLPSANRSWFARFFAGDPGIDPYTRLVSDVYQDLFGEGSFIGKGIYEVEVFGKIVGHRFPEERILSHDLLEGCHVRTGLVSDVQFYEDYPSNYTVDAARRHRWIRGDWQIASWLLPRVPGPDASNALNSLSALSRWKIFDNLRRSLLPAAILTLLMVIWITFPSPGRGTIFILAILFLPALAATLVEALHQPEEPTLRLQLNTLTRHLLRQIGHLAFTLCFLPYDAGVSLDAIARTLWRLLITHRFLLEWQTASDAQKKARHDLMGFIGAMIFAPVMAVLLGTLVWLQHPAALGVALPFIAFWFVSPAIAWWLSCPIMDREVQLKPGQREFLQRLARRTWAYFDTLMNAENNFLPPDNIQEQPVSAVAYRTSPTNMGLGLAALLSAYDFGYITARELIERLDRTMTTMEKLERYRGHFYNWYDTRTLAVLPAPYVSTVDSGNLTALLLTLRQGLAEIKGNPILSEQMAGGLRESLAVLQEETQRAAKLVEGTAALSLHDADRKINEILEDVGRFNAIELSDCGDFLDRMWTSAEALTPLYLNESDIRLHEYLDAFQTQCREGRNFFLQLVPWAPLLSTRPIFVAVNGPKAILWHEIELAIRSLEKIPSCDELVALAGELVPKLDLAMSEDGNDLSAEDRQWLDEFKVALVAGINAVNSQLADLQNMAGRCEALAQADYVFLYDDIRRQMSIGYNVADKRRDASFYDLLASEARLASFVAISMRQLPQEHWFALGRRLTSSLGEPVLLSWSGSMFEYLMPMLVMPSYPNTLLDRTCRAAVKRQIQYGKENGVPWGISESGYNATDAQLNYLYRSFGVPGLGFKRGLTDDLVIAPYASVMALMVDPSAACKNIQELASASMFGHYGLYEAIDYTAKRTPAGENGVIIRSFMAHHEGMSLLALGNVLLKQPMQRRFLNEPIFRATDLLLQERIPETARITLPEKEGELTQPVIAAAEPRMRIYSVSNTAMPEVQLLSNGHYHVMVSAAGSGYSRWGDLSVTRWREDPTRDHWGSYCYIRDLAAKEYWSATHQPTLKQADSYEANFQQSRAEFRRQDHNIVTRMEVSVSTEDDVEWRRLTLTNHSRSRRMIELTSYAEVVLAPAAADAAHPAFSNLFVETEIDRPHRAILCTRRPRADTDSRSWMFHLMVVENNLLGEASFETDRAKFIGRGRTLESPAAMFERRLSNTEGAVLDPIVSVRQTFLLEPEQTLRVGFVTGAAKSKQTAMDLIEKYQDSRLASRVFEMAFTHSQVVRRQLNIGAADDELFGKLIGSIMYANRLHRADPSILVKNRRTQTALWSYGISGDLPIVLLRVVEPSNLEIVRKTLQAHAYWRVKGVSVDLVICNEDSSGYRKDLHDQLIGLIQAGPEAHSMDRPGGVFVRGMDQMPTEDYVLLQTIARIVLSDTAGSFADQVEKHQKAFVEMTTLNPIRRRTHEREPVQDSSTTDDSQLLFFNGFGGFTPDGREYIITTRPGLTTPAPWVNVIANPQLGFVVSENGSMYTWVENAHEFRLTTWFNDPVGDGTGEAYYIRDEETGEYWSPSPLPARGQSAYTARHGMGYSIFEHRENGLHSTLTVYADPAAPVKYVVVKISNESGRRRRASLTGYWEWVLGESREKSLLHVVTEADRGTQSILARNRYHPDFSERVAFVGTNERIKSQTGDRMEFIGRNGTLANPAAMGKSKLAGRFGAGLDACAAMQVPFELADQDQREIVFVLGVGKSTDDALALLQRHRTAQAAREALEGVWSLWNDVLEKVHVETPDPALNILANVWLPYQTLSCRMWGRSGFYQSGGAYGFRDQLQDAMALVHHQPQLLREHLLRCAGRQFLEGDVQHWWHPPAGRGVRTRISDDLLWLPLAVSRYVKITGDTGILNERITYLEGRDLKPGEESYYEKPGQTADSASLYDHCVKAIERSLKFGAHGLPLMGAGDWNDGMNLVGQHGQGESVWLAFFLYNVLNEFSTISQLQKDLLFAQRCRAAASELQQNIELHAWDGHWYRRAYFDDGTPLGSATNLECQIDSLPQSWSVISRGGNAQRQVESMTAVNERLVRRDSHLIQLFDPPFDKSSLNPGYIKGYLPGVRENGGQYTHAAIWTTMAYALLGDNKRAWELFALINPIEHGSTPANVAVYKVEPYVVAADVYGVAPHTGRGGWSWYTGSAGWMYRLLVETLLGLTRTGTTLRFKPCLPDSWTGYKIRYHYHSTCYHIEVKTSENADTEITVDGVSIVGDGIPLADDQVDHHVQLILPKASSRNQADTELSVALNGGAG